MNPGTYNIDAVIGDTFVQRFRFMNKGDYVVLYTLDPTLKIEKDSTPIAEISLMSMSENHLKIVCDDVLLWTMTSDYTNSFTPGTYTYDIYFSFGNDKLTVVSGELNFIEP